MARVTIDKVDYVGFTFGSYHSSQFGIKVVSDGSRYPKYLLPTVQNYTVDIDGGDGSYYFGNTLKSRQFNLNIAFNDVTEQEKREIMVWLNSTISALVFDEEPYITYYAKVDGSPQIQYIPFEDSAGATIYKGEGSITFVCPDPYGYCSGAKKFLSGYTDTNLLEWSTASKLKATQGTYDIYNSGTIPLYNAGDVATDFILGFTFTGGSTTTVVVSLGSSTFTLTLTSLATTGTISIDTKKKLVKYTVSGTTTIINNLLTAGDLFTIPVSSNTQNMSITGTGLSNVSITYSYKYL